MTRWADIQSGRVDLARLAEQRGGWLGAGPEQDEMSEAIDAEIGYLRLSARPVMPADPPELDFWTRMGLR
jgi:hypothetical protein